MAVYNPKLLFWKELLCLTPENRRVEMITITSPEGVSEKAPRMSVIHGLFPEMTSRSERPFITKKPVVFLSARVHGADTPSSVMIEAFIEMLMNDGDQQAGHLLAQYVFVFIPMINPDGVARGYHKLDALG